MDRYDLSGWVNARTHARTDNFSVIKGYISAQRKHLGREVDDKRGGELVPRGGLGLGDALPNGGHGLGLLLPLCAAHVRLDRAFPALPARPPARTNPASQRSKTIAGVGNMLHGAIFPTLAILLCLIFLIIPNASFDIMHLAHPNILSDEDSKLHLVHSHFLSPVHLALPAPALPPLETWSTRPRCRPQCLWMHRRHLLLQTPLRRLSSKHRRHLNQQLEHCPLHLTNKLRRITNSCEPHQTPTPSYAG